MVNLIHEPSLLQKINELAAKRQIQNSVKLTTQGSGSGLTGEEAESKIKKLLPTTRQRINAIKFYLDLIECLDSDFYLKIQVPLPTESETVSPLKPFIGFSDDDSLNVQIKLLENTGSILRERSALVVFIVLNGFFSNLVSLEDCMAKIINIVYDLIQVDERPSDIRKALNNKLPTALLTSHLRTFHAIGQDGKRDETGSPFNIAREIRNKLVHDDIDSVVVSFAPISLSGSASAPRLHFYNSFFAPGTDPADTEMIAFCKKAYNETVGFVNECYQLIRDDLQRSGTLPV